MQVRILPIPFTAHFHSKFLFFNSIVTSPSTPLWIIDPKTQLGGTNWIVWSTTTNNSCDLSASKNSPIPFYSRCSSVRDETPTPSPFSHFIFVANIYFKINCNFTIHSTFDITSHSHTTSTTTSRSSDHEPRARNSLLPIVVLHFASWFFFFSTKQNQVLGPMIWKKGGVPVLINLWWRQQYQKWGRYWRCWVAFSQRSVDMLVF